jgi:hypothetical protein
MSTELAEWNSFYVIVGSSAGALIGLQFVVMALIAETPHALMRKQAPPFLPRASFISGSCCCCQRSSALRGIRSAPSELFWV